MDDSGEDSDLELVTRERVMTKTKVTEDGREKILWSDNEEEDDALAKARREAAEAGKLKARSRTRTVSSKAVKKERRPVSTGESFSSFPNRQKTAVNGKPVTEVKREKRSDHPAGESSSFSLPKRQKTSQRVTKFNDYLDMYSDSDLDLPYPQRPHFPNSTPPALYASVPLHPHGSIPAPMAQYLRDYQLDGAQFMYSKFASHTGGILGDDMGLGKTVQVVAFLTAVFGKKGDERDRKLMRKMRGGGRGYPRVLIVCPGTLISNWMRELDTWGWWHFGKYHGDKKDAELAAAKAGRLEVLITTYTTYKMNEERINQVYWDVCIADECHIIKESQSEVTKAMNMVNSHTRIGLTGTAIQNNYEELWALLNWAAPSTLPDISAWKRTISEPLKIGQSHDATNAQLAKARKVAWQLKTNLLPRFLIRRTKKLIADQLPKKVDRVVFCPLTETQKEAYQNLLDTEDVDFIIRRGDKCECGSGMARSQCCHRTTRAGLTLQQLIFPYMVQIQKLANHLALIIPRNEDTDDARARDARILEECLPHRHKELMRRESIINSADPELCGKWKVLEKLLAHWYAEGSKVLIFSYSTRLLGMLNDLMMRLHYTYCYLDGSMPLDARTDVVDKFNSDPHQFAFLISTKAGGVGLNIVSANKVVIFDPNWNPAHDLQAQDRAFRIGQLRDVEVYRLISAGTIEENVYARQIYKQQQANIGYEASEERRYFKGVMGAEGRQGELFGLGNMFTYDSGRMLLKGIVNKTNVREQQYDIADMNVGDADQQEGADEDGTSGTSQIAKLLETGNEDAVYRKRTVDPVTAILSEVGVEYTHNNSEIIGPSELEAKISKAAATAADNDALASKPAYLQASGDQDKYQVGNVPRDVAMRQFNSMALAEGYSLDGEGREEFALRVLEMTSAERQKLLRRFYAQRRELLDDQR
ncbi:hypothetical protein G7K_4300-t1 [Saitoella complicata NRRL Y-17804]|uniref:Uncharacterized protein n=2 Tax=Saitoella complicata (strain BCRC 22490 / CBS 7301 / JCM 7358 / NBRC 10748 / NRRL Y-17804) TaxID=698492 RepID=A0A0E9NKE5_SAICN|nr:hypothetical protein G7K_4300-t1 [Saitoella complicata NRRL Y-17804]